MKPYSQLIPPILDAGLPVLLYQGQMDMRDGVAATMAWLPTMRWAKLSEWFATNRTTWVSPAGAVEPYDNSVPMYAGYIRSFEGLTHMTVAGAGHLVPMDQPERAQEDNSEQGCSGSGAHQNSRTSTVPGLRSL